MGKVKMVKKQKKKGGQGQSSPGTGNFQVGALGDLIAASCGVTEADFDPQLTSLFSGSRKGAVVKVQEVKVQALPTPPPRTTQRKERVDNQRNEKDAKVRTGTEAVSIPIIPKMPATGAKIRTGTKAVAIVAKPIIPKMSKNMPPPKIEKRKVNRSAERNAVKKEIKEESEGDQGMDTETKKVTLRQLNAPKEKNVELEGRTIFVGNVPKEGTKKQLMKFFNALKCGKIETIRLRCAAPDKPTKLKKVAMNRKELHPDRQSVAAYIRYMTREEAEAVLEKSKETQGLVFLGHHLNLDLADGSVKKDRNRGIFVGNLHLKTEDDELREFFSDCGTIESVRIIRDRESGLGKGFGYVNFSDRGSVELAISKDASELKNRPLRISRCVKKLKTVESRKPTNSFKQGVAGPGSNTLTKKRKSVSQGKRQRSEDFSGDKTSEIGKFKRHSKKPNKEILKKVQLAEKLAVRRVPEAEFKAKKKEIRKQNKPRWRNKTK